MVPERAVCPADSRGHSQFRVSAPTHGAKADKTLPVVETLYLTSSIPKEMIGEGDEGQKSRVTWPIGATMPVHNAAASIFQGNEAAPDYSLICSLALKKLDSMIVR